MFRARFCILTLVSGLMCFPPGQGQEKAAGLQLPNSQLTRTGYSKYRLSSQGGAIIMCYGDRSDATFANGVRATLQITGSPLR